ncbi:MAG: isoleucine--tRNA ligase [bacterium]|nr:isoleucine--tRNA ligase [bacterium]
MARTNFSEMEQALVEHWKKEKIFERSVEERPEDKQFVFYDGPPFATGLPHYGHIVASTLKDVIPRYATMRGHRVERRWGWDCHGLPIENLIEKELGLETKQDIEAIGVDKFNDACQASVLKYAKEWQIVIERLGRWVDMDNDYRTMDTSYTESIWWAFKNLYDQGLIYEGKKAMHLCPRCETTLSNFEVTLGYKDITDQSVTAQFKLQDEEDTYLLAWTTTPWTLPGNVGLAIGPDVDYVQVSSNDKRFILARERVAEVFSDVEHTIEEAVANTELIGKKYQPLFPYFIGGDMDGSENMFTIWEADFVTTDEGTGIVHIASGYGEDDYQLSIEKNIPLIQHVGTDGKYISAVTDFAGEDVKPTDNHMASDQKIVKYLQETGGLFWESTYLHSYPHCWRCDTPLLNYATASWFVKVTDLKERMIKHNKEILWVPDHIKEGRFGKWLEGAKDWAISRDRYWGAPLPVWQSADGDTICVSSIAELKELSGVEVDDLHKQHVDKVVINKDGKEYHRVPQVLDCWFESGSMPYAQEHYPFENKEKYEATFPAQFIAEGLDQTRGWFYTLIVLSTALFDKPAFKNVIVNGLVLAEDGKKMSKRLKNYPEPNIVMEKYGADALRFYLMNSPVVNAENLRFSEQGVDQVMKRLIMTLWNVHTFYAMFADGQDVNEQPDSEHVMDKWILAYLNKSVIEITDAMEKYELLPVTRQLEELVQQISTWYLRRSRDRFKGNDEEKKAALSTLRYVLLTTVKLLAPFTPFISERIYLDMSGPLDSVHLDTWPESNTAHENEQLLTDMDALRQYVEKTLASREEAGIKVRQPLAWVSIPGVDKLADGLKEVLAGEVNVKNVKDGQYFDLNVEITEELAKEGLFRELVRSINALRKKQKLTINDQVVVEYKTDDALLKSVITELSEDLQKSVLASSFSEGDGEVELKVNGIALSITLTVND